MTNDAALGDLISQLKKKVETLSPILMKITEDSVNPSPTECQLTPLNLLKARAAMEMAKEVEIVQNNLIEGYSAIFEVLQEKQIDETDELLSLLTRQSEHLLQMLNFEDMRSESETLQRKIDLPDAYLDLMYRATLHLYHSNQNSKALQANFVCISLSPYTHRFWQLYGILLQNKQDHAAAVYAFQVALNLDETDAHSQAYMARSLMALNLKKEAKEAMAKTLKLCHQKKDLEPLANYCTRYS